MRLEHVISLFVPLLATAAWASPPCGTEACVLEAYHKVVESGEASPQVRVAALPTFQAGCEAGMGAACYLAGGLLAEGIGLDKDMARAVGFWERGCKAQHPMSCATVAEFHLGTKLTPEGVVQQTRAAVSACELASKQRDPQLFEICAVVATATMRLDWRTAEHRSLARELWDKLTYRHAIGGAYASRPHGVELRSVVRANLSFAVCEARVILKPELVGPACLELAGLIRDDVARAHRGLPRALGESSSVEVAAAIEGEMCRLGVSKGCIAQADALNQATSATPNHVGGTPIAAKLCEEGTTDGCYRVVDWHRRCDPTQPVVGGDLPCDPKAARTGWQERCAGGHKASCTVVEGIDRLITARSERLAAERAQCLKGELAACTSASGAMPWGAARVAFFDQACELGNQTACLIVAMALSKGEGVAHDHERAARMARELCREREYTTACDVFCGVYEGVCFGG